MPRAVKPTGNARRGMTYTEFGALTKKRPESSLTLSLKKHAGRDKRGHISIRHRGGGAKRLYRIIDFKFLPFEGKATVKALEYDPNRSSFIALLEMPDGSKKYVLATENMKAGDTLTSGVTKGFSHGSRNKLKDIPVGYEVHNIEMQPGRGGQSVRSAGSSATITAKEGKYAYIRMPSSEIRRILIECMASVGRVSNTTHNLVRLSKAGRVRHMGWRPTVRGKAMNPNSHPHGGGEAVNPIGLKYPKTPWGKHALGVKTRRNKRTDKFIVSRRKKK
ncbi:MAG: 50S ribosomal protein L2 [Candidatus Berkelbacteria bacterium]|nr:MAG: 50S ribosomal protein L2 [Candidatus Berkelbacteria bacterium]QQG52095.1 MAG: 50S ribosomal protein L2 [Candidatus Berkelbacteria bacterium]